MRVGFVSVVSVRNLFQRFLRCICVGGDLTHVLKHFRKSVHISFRPYTHLEFLGSSCYTVLATSKSA